MRWEIDHASRARLQDQIASCVRRGVASGELEIGEQLPPESTRVQVRAEDVLRETAGVLTRLFDVTATKDWANCTARADVKVEVSPSGQVSGTLIRGEFAGTPTGACIENKLKQAVFPASSGLRFDYLLTVR